jgi:diguanylate cyclase (GGDEF)-like protein/PAS domain S-box-containing protein
VGAALGLRGLVGHLYGAATLSSLQTAVEMAVPTVLAALACSVAVLLERPDLPASRAVRAQGTGGALVRASLLWALVVPVVVGLLVVRGEEAGLFDPAYGQSLMVLVLTAGSVGAVVLGARVAQRADRHRAAAADRERLQYLLDGTPVGIFETDASGHRTYVNQRWRELTGADRVTGDDWREVLHPDDRDRVAAEWAAAIDRAEPYAGRYRYLREDGSVTWVDTTTTAIRNPDGSVSRWLGSVTDVTEQVEATRNLWTSERRYRSVVASMAEGVILQDSEGTVLTSNQAAHRILGAEPGDLAGRRAADRTWQVVADDGSLLPDDELPGRRALLTGRPVRGATVGIQQQDGSVTWLEVNAEPLLDSGPDGAPVVTGVVTTFADVTDARAAARALARSEEQFRSAMEHAPVGMAIVALDGTFMEVNHALCRLVDYDELDLLGKTFQQITHHDDLRSDLDKLALLTAGTIDHYEMEKRYIRRDGEIVWVLLAVSMARDVDDAPAYYVAQVQDVTAARAAQERLEHQALHDPLTGLANRDLLMDRLSHALARSARSGLRTLVMFCDLDHFKDVNDTLGHETGDHVLVTVADRLRAAVRPGDTVARLGGDEFVVVAEQLPGAEAERALADRVQAVLDKPVRIGGTEVRMGASLGLAVAGPDADARSLLREADAAMYRAKARGRGRYAVSHETPVGAVDRT